MLNQQFLIQEYHRDTFLVSTDPDKLDIDVIHHFLANEAYWSPGVARETVTRAMEHSLCFGVYDSNGRQAGFARLITDFTTFAYLADVFILRPYRGQGLGQWLVECMLAHPQLRGLRKWTLNTKDAHTLYQRFGFETDPRPENYLVYRPGSRP